jgi:hypothetical protein
MTNVAVVSVVAISIVIPPLARRAFAPVIETLGHTRNVHAARTFILRGEMLIKILHSGDSTRV